MGVVSGYRIIELAGLGPCPMAGMILADMGAEVIVIDRGPNTDPMYVKDVSRRGKKSIILNLKSDEGKAALLQLVASADALIEGYRPGVTEKLGIGPEDCWQVNEALVYGRMTGWGQTGPLATVAGHDINYISLTGALHAIGRKGERPVPPINLVGDYGGGTMFLVTGVLGALLEAKGSGKGQVVDAAMIDGAANLMWMCHSFQAAGHWNFDERGDNFLDGGKFYYDTYETADGKYVAVGAIEPQFFNLLVEIGGLDPFLFNRETQNDPSHNEVLRTELSLVFKQKTRDQWAEIFEGSDACFSPILSADEAPNHPHNRARNTYIEVDGQIQPSPAPRFSRTPSSVRHSMREAGSDADEVLLSVGYSEADIASMKAVGAVR